MTAQGVGASLSPAIGGWLAQWHGYGSALLILGSFALGAVLIWTVFAAPSVARLQDLQGDARA